MSVRLWNAAALVLMGLMTSTAMAAGSAPQPDVCDRACWGARPPSSTPSQMPGLTRAVIHHTAFSGSYDTTSQEESKAFVRGVQNFHMDVNGWSDIGYHFLGDRLGNVFEGREGSLTSLPRGAHDGVNQNSMGFSMMGYFHDPYNQEPSEEIRCAMYSAIAWKVPDPFTGMGAGTYDGDTVGYVAGHRDVGSTACPGDLMWDAYIGLDFDGGEARQEVNSMISQGEGLMCGGGPLCCPGSPTLGEVIVTDDGVSVSWSDVGEVQNYHVRIIAEAGGVTTQTVVEVPTGVTTLVDRDAAPGELRTYAVSAVGTLSESIPSDAYSARITTGDSRVLVVDGNDRWLTQSENATHINHSFAAVTGAAIPTNVGFDTVDNAAVEQGLVSLGAYDAVVWSLGEESTRDETFSSAEQLAVDTYLNEGGSLFVSGAEIGWDLYNEGSAADQDFYTFKLQASYVADDAGQTIAYAEAGGIFDGASPLDFSGGPMIIDFPDVIAPGAGAQPALYYTRTTAGDAADRFAAITYDGSFKVIYLAFPFESIFDDASRELIMGRSLDFLGVVGEDGSPSEVHIGGLQLNVMGRGRAVAKVSVVNGLGRPVGGVDVVGSFDGDVVESATAATGRLGSALLVAAPAGTSDLTFTFCVDALEGDGLLWDSSADVVTCATYEPTP